jgi:hypothetical protein
MTADQFRRKLTTILSAAVFDSDAEGTPSRLELIGSFWSRG